MASLAIGCPVTKLDLSGRPVTKLDLSGRGLTALPEDITRHALLETLDLSNNNLNCLSEKLGGLIIGPIIDVII